MVGICGRFVGKWSSVKIRLSKIHLLQGTGYWEFLLEQFYSVDVIAFDSNTTYPDDMHYVTIQVSTVSS